MRPVRQRGVDGNCNWPGCKQVARYHVIDSGLGYCERHFGSVWWNRRWLETHFADWLNSIAGARRARASRGTKSAAE
jgi:hypothetical protein